MSEPAKLHVVTVEHDAPLPANDEVLLLRAVYRAASAHLAAPYLPEHEQALHEAVVAYHDFRAS